MIEKIAKTLHEWEMLLTPQQFRVTRLGEDEVQFSGKYDNFHEDGKYVCVCCGNNLFGCRGKYKEGKGWPYFFAPYGFDSVVICEDKKSNLDRKEVVCVQCDAHLGYLFEKEDYPTGKNFRINSTALRFIPQKDGEGSDECLV